MNQAPLFKPGDYFILRRHDRWVNNYSLPDRFFNKSWEVIRHVGLTEPDLTRGEKFHTYVTEMGFFVPEPMMEKIR